MNHGASKVATAACDAFQVRIAINEWDETKVTMNWRTEMTTRTENLLTLNKRLTIQSSPGITETPPGIPVIQSYSRIDDHLHSMPEILPQSSKTLFSLP